MAAIREAPFTSEEAEIFRIFALQGEAALKNLLLFEEVKSLAIRDGLTGLYNYRYFWEMLNQQVGQSRRYDWPLSLLFLDLDDFKAVNDTWGHQTGDLVRTVAKFLREAVRQADLLCRYGGEEFVVLLPQTDADHALVLAERLRSGIAATPIRLSDRELKVTVSVGLAELLPDLDGAALVAAADAASTGPTRELAARGFGVLRFDMVGHGDSGGRFEDASIDAYLADIRHAAARLQASLTGLKAVGFLGLRLGASLAILAAEQCPQASCLIFWDPIVDGEKHAQELLLTSLSSQMAAYGRVVTNRTELIEAMKAGKTVNIDGYELSHALFSQIAALRLAEATKRFDGWSLISQIDRGRDAGAGAQGSGDPAAVLW